MCDRGRRKRGRGIYRIGCSCSRLAASRRPPNHLDEARRHSAVATTLVYLRAGSFFGCRFNRVICLMRAESSGLQVATSGSSLNAL